MMAKTPFVLAVLLLAVIGQLMNKLTRLDADLLEDFSRGPKSSVLLSLDAGDVCTNGTSSSMMGKNHRGNAAYANAIRTPLTLGVEIRGIRLAEHLADDGLFERIKADCYRHRLLVFRGQGQLPADALLKMFEGFGDIYHQPYTTQTKDMNNHRRAPAPYVLRFWSFQ
jgi:hypothetical protein